MSLSEAIVTGLQTTVVGLATVFAVLIILMLVLKVFEKVFAGQNKPVKKEEVKKAPAPVVPTVSNDDEEELIAVLTAAIAASLNTSVNKIKIKSYRRISNNTPAWQKAGLREIIDARY